MNDLNKTIQHFESLQKRYIGEHDGRACDRVADALEALEAYRVESDEENKNNKNKKLTNADVIKLFAKKNPMLIVEMFDDFYCVGFNSGSRASWQGVESFEDDIPVLNEKWLNSEYDKEFFREWEVNKLILI